MAEAEVCPIKNNELLKKSFELTKKTIIPDEYGNTLNYFLLNSFPSLYLYNKPTNTYR
jgi:hypothetical protein